MLLKSQNEVHSQTGACAEDYLGSIYKDDWFNPCNPKLRRNIGLKMPSIYKFRLFEDSF